MNWKQPEKLKKVKFWVLSTVGKNTMVASPAFVVSECWVLELRLLSNFTCCTSFCYVYSYFIFSAHYFAEVFKESNFFYCFPSFFIVHMSTLTMGRLFFCSGFILTFLHPSSCIVPGQSAGIGISRLTFTVELGIKEKRQPLQEEIFFLTGWMHSCFFYMFISVCVHLLCSLPRWLLQVHGFFFLLGELCISPAQHYVLSYYIYEHLYPCVDTGCLTPYTLCIDCVCCSELP